MYLFLFVFTCSFIKNTWSIQPRLIEQFKITRCIKNIDPLISTEQKNLVGVYWTVAGVINNPRHRTGFSDLIREISKFVSWQLDQDNVSCTVTAWLSCKLHSHRYPANLSAIRHWCVSVCTYIITYIGRYAKTLVVYKHWFFFYHCIW